MPRPKGSTNKKKAAPKKVTPPPLEDQATITESTGSTTIKTVEIKREPVKAPPTENIVFNPNDNTHKVHRTKYDNKGHKMYEGEIWITKKAFDLQKHKPSIEFKLPQGSKLSLTDAQPCVNC